MGNGAMYQTIWTKNELKEPSGGGGVLQGHFFVGEMPHCK